MKAKNVIKGQSRRDTAHVQLQSYLEHRRHAPLSFLLLLSRLQSRTGGVLGAISSSHGRPQVFSRGGFRDAKS